MIRLSMIFRCEISRYFAAGDKMFSQGLLYLMNIHSIWLIKKIYCLIASQQTSMICSINSSVRVITPAACF